jgi:hypothetical protein
LRGWRPQGDRPDISSDGVADDLEKVHRNWRRRNGGADPHPLLVRPLGNLIGNLVQVLGQQDEICSVVRASFSLSYELDFQRISSLPTFQVTAPVRTRALLVGDSAQATHVCETRGRHHRRQQAAGMLTRGGCTMHVTLANADATSQNVTSIDKIIEGFERERDSTARASWMSTCGDTRAASSRSRR